MASGAGSSGGALPIDPDDAARLLAMLLATDEEDLEGYRERCLGRDSTLDVEKLRLARELLVAVGTTLQSAQDEDWQCLKAALEAMARVIERAARSEEGSAGASALEHAPPVAPPQSIELPPIASDVPAPRQVVAPQLSRPASVVVPTMPARAPSGPSPVSRPASVVGPTVPARAPSGPSPVSRPAIIVASEVPRPVAVERPARVPADPAAPSSKPLPQSLPFREGPAAVPPSALGDLPPLPDDAKHGTVGLDEDRLSPLLGLADAKAPSFLRQDAKRVDPQETIDTTSSAAQSRALPFVDGNAAAPPSAVADLPPLPVADQEGTVGLDEELLSPLAFAGHPFAPRPSPASAAREPATERGPERKASSGVTESVDDSASTHEFRSPLSGRRRNDTTATELLTLEGPASPAAASTASPEAPTERLYVGAHPPSSRATTAASDLERYAWRCACREAQGAAKVPAGLSRDEQQLEADWQRRIDADPSLRARFAQLLSHYRAWIAQGRT